MSDIETPDGQPTWARIYAGAGVALPSRDGQGNPSTVPPGVPVRLDHVGTDADGNQVWALPADRWSPGCRVELGPLPEGVRVRLDGRSRL